MFHRKTRLILAVIFLSITLVGAGCTASRGQNTITPDAEPSGQTQSLSPGLTSPTPDVNDLEPVATTIDAKNLTITNQTAGTIFYQVFPQELLAVIEWSPCNMPEQCQDARLDPMGTVSIPLETIANKETTSITVFWWNLEKAAGEAGYQVINLNFIDLDID